MLSLIGQVCLLLVLSAAAGGCSPHRGDVSNLVQEIRPTNISSSPPISKSTIKPISTQTHLVAQPTVVSETITTPVAPPLSPTPLPTSTATPYPTASATATIKPSPTKAGNCRSRIPSDDLLTLVTSDYAISADYVPGDLVNLSDYLPLSVTLGYETQLREEAALSLTQLVQDMEEAGLRPQILSGYRSYIAQQIAWQKWQERQPERASIISVPPGHSEHQLGTTVDFGSPELAVIVGDSDIEFHTYFFKTAEGMWLADHAHEYGFSLSYPREAFELTGFFFEPWHYRYVGVELATELKNAGVSLTQYLLETYPPPCDP